MKFVRFILGTIICLLAIYGGYQIYLQHFGKDEFSDDFLKELRDSGFDVGSGDGMDAVSAMMQSDLGEPTASFGMSGSNTLPPSGSPGGASPAAVPGGLPPSLRNSAGRATTVAPEQQPLFPDAPTTPPPASPPPPPATAPTGHETSATKSPPDAPVFANANTPGVMFFTPSANQPAQSSASTPAPSSGNLTSATPGTLPPSFATTAQTTLSTDAAVTPTQSPPQTPAASQSSETAVAAAGSAPSIRTQSQGNAESPQTQGPSAYTFGVAVPPAGDIDTTTQTVQSPENPSVMLSPVLPRERQPATPCVQEMAAYRPPVMTADSQVRSLPPVGNEPTATSVAPPGFAPRMGVTALPPVDDEPDAPNASLVAAVQNAPPNAAPTAAHPNVPTFTPGSVPTTIPPDINARLTWPQESDADHGFAVSGANHKNEPRAMAVEMPASVPASTMISQQPQPQTLHEAQPAPPHAAQQQPLQQAATAPMASQPTIIQANGVTPLPHSQNADIAPEVAAKVAKIGELLAQNRVPDAYEQLSQMYFHDEMTAEERQYVAKHLDQLAGGVLFSRRHHVLEPAYLVKDGDTAESIANQYKITPELLRKLNGIPNDGNVTAGTQLKILRGPLDARIYPGYHEMVVVTRGKYACRFPISVGSSYAGQEGNFTVQEKALNRGYQLAPGLEVIPPGDPANPLGSRWIELSKEQGTIGVHGTNMPEQIGTTRRSAGFFGLREQDIAEVYDMLTVGSNVTIVR